MKPREAAYLGAAGHIPTVQELIDTPVSELPRLDMALCNLVCATGLPGAEDMNIPEYMRRLQSLTEYVRNKTERQLPMFRQNPGQFHFPRPVTENFFRIIVLVHALKIDAGLRYNPQRADQENSNKPFSAKDMFINGLLSDQRIGTCNTIPVLIAALGRRLGYPLYLCCTHQHVWTRWDGGGERFNIEASGPNEFSDFDDDHYRSDLEPARKAGTDTSYYLKNLTPADELALFLFSRAWVLGDHKRFEEGLPAWAKCCFLAPTEPSYPRRAYDAAFETVHIRKFGKPSRRGPDGRPLTSPPVGEDLSKLLPRKTLARYLSIMGHYHEAEREVDRALPFYGAALEDDPGNPDYRADLRRYLKRLARDGRMVPGTRALAATLGLEHELASACEERGLAFAKANNWPEAQCAFAHGSRLGRAGRRCGEHLLRSIRREIAAGKEPLSGQSHRVAGRAADPRLSLPHELQAGIWSVRDLELRRLGRLDQAFAACKEACRLWPDNPLYAEELRRFSRELGQPNVQQEPAAQSLFPPAQGHVVLDTGQSSPVPGMGSPIYTVANWFSGSLLSSLPVINAKE